MRSKISRFLPLAFLFDLALLGCNKGRSYISLSEEEKSA